MFKSKYLLTLFTACLIFMGAYAGSKLTLNITSKSTKQLSFEVLGGGKEPYQITLAGENYKVKRISEGKM